MMQEFIEFLLGSFAALFPVVDPAGAVPLFLMLTAGESSDFRDQLAGKISLYTVVVLVLFLLIGGGILRFFGVSLGMVKIAGGIVIFHTAWHTMNADPKLTEPDNQEVVEKSHKHEDISFVPMTIPMLAGPGSIAVTLGLTAQAGRSFSVETGLNILAVSIAIMLMGGITYLCLRSSSWLSNRLGEVGIRAVSRILGLFILAVGVQLILNGFADWLAHLEIINSGG